MERLTRGEAIRAKCLDCCCGSYSEVRLCPCPDCPLYRYRLGREDIQGCNDTTEEKDTENGTTLPSFEENNGTAFFDIQEEIDQLSENNHENTIHKGG